MTTSLPVQVNVLIDALGWKFLEKRPFLSDLLPYRRPLQTVLGFSSGAIPTILTGLAPSAHQHWNLFYYDPDGSPFRWLRRFRFAPDSIVNHRVTRKALKEMGKHFLGLGKNFECCVRPSLLPYFNFVEKRNIYARGGVEGAQTIFDVVAERRIPHRIYSYHETTDKEILRRARSDIENSDAIFYFIYLCEMDMALHNSCRDMAAFEHRLAWYESELREVFELAQKRDPEARLALFSDHGMTPVEQHIDLVKIIDALGFAMPADYLAVYDSTMARFWFMNGKAREKIAACLEKQPCGRILPDEELRRLGVLFEDRRYGEMVFLLHPGWLLAHSDFHGKGWMPSGMHGYHPEDPYSDAVFLSSFEPPADVQTIADIFGCMKAGIDEAPLAG
ncbi:MAG: alkaline phosphatase family protein [Acidobacteriota bacterium]|nr:alkaline phosphatase family protein [Acidobacteriota bacterium]